MPATAKVSKPTSLVEVVVTLLALATPFILVVAGAPNRFTPTVADPIVTESAIEGQSEAEVGELVRLRATGDSVDWTVLPATSDTQVFGDNDQNMVVSFRERGTYTVIAAILKGSELGIETLQVNVGYDPGPDGPSAPDRPSPSFIPEKVAVDVEISNRVTEWCRASGMGPQVAVDLQEVFEKVAREIDRGDLVTAQGIISRTASLSNQLELVANEGVLDNIQKLLTKQSNAGNLEDPKDHSYVWRSIARGFQRHVESTRTSMLSGSPRKALEEVQR